MENEYGGNVSKFADENGISTTYYYKWKDQDSGKKEGTPNPSLEVLLSIVNNKNINPVWLLTGEGEMKGGQMNRQLNRKVNQYESLIDDLNKTDITPDEKLEFVLDQLELILKFARS